MSTFSDFRTNGKPYGSYIAQAPDGGYVVASWNLTSRRCSILRTSNASAIQLQREGMRYEPQRLTPTGEQQARNPRACYVCDNPESGSHVGHTYWANEDAEQYFADETARMSAKIPSMSAAETLDPREAVIA